jgi:hypothetical protein
VDEVENVLDVLEEELEAEHEAERGSDEGR